jgi:hypothetical protein
MKTPEQLRREIAYFAAQLQRTTSPDRIRRAHVAIRVRERQLVEAVKAEATAAAATRPSGPPSRAAGEP